MKSKSIAAATNSINKAQFKGLGHLTSLGELKMLFNNMPAIADMASRLQYTSAHAINSYSTYLSSTLYNAGYTVWACQNGNPSTKSRSDTGNMRFITVMNVD